MKHCQVTYLLSKLMRDLGTEEREEEALAVHIALNVFQSQAAEEKLQMSVKRKPLLNGRRDRNHMKSIVDLAHENI
jgi:hypothetical protein